MEASEVRDENKIQVKMNQYSFVHLLICWIACIVIIGNCTVVDPYFGVTVFPIFK